MTYCDKSVLAPYCNNEECVDCCLHKDIQWERHIERADRIRADFGYCEYCGQRVIKQTSI